MLVFLIMIFVGAALIMHGLYEEKIRECKKQTKIKYKFIPRSYYDEWIFQSSFGSKFNFEDVQR